MIPKWSWTTRIGRRGKLHYGDLCFTFWTFFRFRLYKRDSIISLSFSVAQMWTPIAELAMNTFLFMHKTFVFVCMMNHNVHTFISLFNKTCFLVHIQLWPSGWEYFLKILTLFHWIVVADLFYLTKVCVYVCFCFCFCVSKPFL